MIFSHSGDQGDLIYHLTAIRTIGGGHLRLHPSNFTGRRMSPQGVSNLRQLLERQSYILSVAYAEHPEGLNLDHWRKHYDASKNISDMLHEWLHLEKWPREQPWLDGIDPNAVAPVVFCRTFNYNNQNFPWHAVFRKYHRNAVFIGMPQEYEAFVGKIGRIPYYPTQDLYRAAQVIAGSRLFVCNQTSLRAIAEGLKKKILVEVDPRINNTHFQRPDAYYGLDESATLPEFE